MWQPVVSSSQGMDEIPGLRKRLLRQDQYLVSGMTNGYLLYVAKRKPILQP